MGNPNPFYRFKQGWNAGFYPDNQIVSDLLNEIHTNLTGLLPGWAIVGTTKVEFLFQLVKNYINTYNQSPYLGAFDVSLEFDYLNPDGFRILIKDPNLLVVDSSQYLEIYGEYFSPTNSILTIPVVLSPFSTGSYVGTFDAPLIPEESKVREALNVVYMNGSAIFPITYSFNPSTNFAISGLARGKNWKLDDGDINRFPVPTNPFENQRTFELPELNGDDTYIISIIERIIQASMIDADYTTSVLSTYNSFTLPDGWIGSVNHPAFTTYERVQFNFVDSTRRKFILIGRKDTTWLWQRFVSDDYATAPYDFLTPYVEATALPYEVSQAGRWIYPNSTYDYEFVEFTSGCYVSPEFYPMPAKPGDQYQFNVIDGNITGLNSVNVGLFSTTGQFIQKIGQTELLPTPDCECVDCAFRMELNFNEEAFANYLDQLNEILVANPANNVFLFKYEYLIDGVIQTDPNQGTEFEPGFTFDVNDIIQYCNFGGFEFAVVDGLNRFSLEVPNAICGSTYQFKQYFKARVNQGEAEFQIMWDSDIYECPTPVPTYELNQHQATVTIPSKQGCYRMGLYDIVEGTEPQTDCNLSIVYYLSEDNTSQYYSFIETLESIAISAFPYVTFEINGIKYTYSVPGVPIPDLTDITAWATANIPGMIAQDLENFARAFFKWEGTVECGEEGYTINCYQSDDLGNEIDAIWQSEPKYCNCEPNCSVFAKNSTGDSGLDCLNALMTQISANPTENVALVLTNPGNTLYTVINKFPCSVITDQSILMTLLNSIPGFFIYKVPLTIGCSYSYMYQMDMPCDANTYGWRVDIVDATDTLITPTSIGSTNYLYSCECNSTCEATFTYTMTENATQWLTDLITAETPYYSIYLEAGGNVVNQYLFPIGEYTDISEAVFFFNSIPGMTCTWDGESVLSWTWVTQIPCDTDVIMRLAGLDTQLLPVDGIWSTDTENCPCPIVPEPGQFYSALYSLSNIINIDKSDCFSTILEFWGDNETMAEGFEYYNNWKQRVRIGLNGGGEKPVIEESLYRQSNGVHRRPQNKQDLSIDLHTDFFDLETQLAMTDATRHPYFVWNGQSVFVKGDLEVATIQDFTNETSFETLSQMKFQVLKQGFQPKNSSCLNC